jgi:glutaredoxin
VALIFACAFAFLTSAKAAEVQPKADLTLFYLSYCPYCQEVLGFLNSIYKTIPMRDVNKDASAKADLKKMGGMLEVPCLIINGYAIYRAKPIIEWLSEHQEDLDDALPFVKGNTSKF